ncbi:MAG: hypothetical protein N3I35_06715 [Clostridia bacterium]|nr:hypothetical protein [Clostridia bacterium]
MLLYMLEKRLNEVIQALCGLYTQKETIDRAIMEHKAIVGELQLQIKAYNEKCKAVSFDKNEVFDAVKSIDTDLPEVKK